MSDDAEQYGPFEEGEVVFRIRKEPCWRLQLSMLPVLAVAVIFREPIAAFAARIGIRDANAPWIMAALLSGVAALTVLALVGTSRPDDAGGNDGGHGPGGGGPQEDPPQPDPRAPGGNELPLRESWVRWEEEMREHAYSPTDGALVGL